MQELAFVLDYESVSSLSHLEAGRKLPTLETALHRLTPDIATLSSELLR